MSVLKTCLSVWFFTSFLVSNAHANTHDLLTKMAGCTGRFSAELEHAWLMQDRQREELEQQRENFIAILDAITPAASARTLLAHRVDAKQAQSVLLKLGEFATDPNQATWARQQARHYREQCASLLLDG